MLERDFFKSEFIVTLCHFLESYPTCAAKSPNPILVCGGDVNAQQNAARLRHANLGVRVVGATWI